MRILNMGSFKYLAEFTQFDGYSEQHIVIKDFENSSSNMESATSTERSNQSYDKNKKEEIIKTNSDCRILNYN